MDKQTKSTPEIGIGKALIAGVALGAAAMLVTDKKKRDQAKDFLVNLKDQASQAGGQLSKEAKKLGSEVSKSAESIAESSKTPTKNKS